MPAIAAPQPESFSLQNGMEVLVIPDHRAPVVTHMVWYRVGSGDEPAGKSGIAHLFEHLMFKEADNIPAGEFSRIVARNGGQDNAFTSRDYTAYFQRVAKDRLPLMMRMEATRMTTLRLSEEEVLPERNVVTEERRQRIGNNPRAVLNEKMTAALYRNHPYAIPVIGHMHEVSALSRQDALDFYHRWYGPENAILVVAGDITVAQLQPIAEQIYGSIPRKGGIKRPNLPPVTELENNSEIFHHDPKIRQTEYVRMWLGLDSTDQDRYALQVAMQLLGGGRTSYLYQKMIDERQLAVAVNASEYSHSLGRGAIRINLVPAPGISTKTLARELEQELAHFIATTPDKNEVERAKSNLIAEITYAEDSQTSIANWLGASMAIGLDVNDVVARKQYLQEIRPKDIQNVLIRLLGSTHSVSGHLLPETMEHTG